MPESPTSDLLRSSKILFGEWRGEFGADLETPTLSVDVCLPHPLDRELALPLAIGCETPQLLPLPRSHGCNNGGEESTTMAQRRHHNG
mmetsp:Transcript_98427/g.199823  ORF Transcript_98427/g.199823 Transcript_98427/m.199823 type:complete len:88 (+) Transcript_98427:61-324(+)